jgi:YebC/PmpR family DNA-binding regulatory protein
MSGHSKWSKIKRGKAIEDAKRGKIFSKIARLILVAVKEKGGDPTTNPRLRMAIEQAKAVNMPNENIERAIARGAGGTEGAKMEDFLYEAYGPGGIALLIEGITDNKNRTLGEMRNILSKNSGKFVESGGVSYLFQKKGVILVNTGRSPADKEALALSAIDAGAEDIKWRDNNILEIYMQPEAIDKAKQALEENQAQIESSSLAWVPITEIEIAGQKTKDQITKLLDALEEQDDVNEIYSNLKLES